jgi:cytochrome c-type biogenesis protein CcmH/NrfG
MCELADNRLAQAADAFRQALLLEPRALDAMEGMAVVAGRQGRGELATSYRSRVAAIRGENE